MIEKWQSQYSTILHQTTIYDIIVQVLTDAVYNRKVYVAFHLIIVICKSWLYIYYISVLLT